MGWQQDYAAHLDNEAFSEEMYQKDLRDDGPPPRHTKAIAKPETFTAKQLSDAMKKRMESK